MSLLSSEEVRLWNLRWLAAENGGLTSLAKRLGRPQPMLSSYIGKGHYKRLGRDFCAFVEQTLHLDSQWLDQPHPELWVKIQNPAWQREISRELPKIELQVEDGPLAELCDIAQRLQEPDQLRLVDFARVLSR